MSFGLDIENIFINDKCYMIVEMSETRSIDDYSRLSLELIEVQITDEEKKRYSRLKKLEKIKNKKNKSYNK